MNMQEIRAIAKTYGIKTGKLTKMKLVQAIQLEEGNFDCFATACSGECDQTNCSWRKDCFAAAKKMVA
ncbi:SAP domain-containing protein [Aliikangiella marina]|uniref:SAP domain-containing protein n=2 Tax=Aliikangiella marina TaxID=1712262 RepID=A0A545T7K7_9GAMM|nr:SAP domain-containing protein [Aliikangiella marina]